MKIKPFSDIICIFGRKGRGKTVYTKFLVRQLKRYIIIDTTWQFDSYGYVVHFPERIKEFENFPHLVFQPKHYDKESLDLVFQECLKYHNYTLVIDEIDRFARPRWYISEHLREIINRGRRQGIGIICNSRRPASTHNDLRSNADYVITFQLHEQRDLEYVSDWIGVDESAIRQLREHQSLLWEASAQMNKVILQQACPYYP